jgi:hypothetical protein
MERPLSADAVETAVTHRRRAPIPLMTERVRMATAEQDNITFRKM